jgi:hypothetical protein
MTTIAFSCACGKALRVKEEHAGKKLRCPACRNVLTVPSPMDNPDFEVIEDEAEGASAGAAITASRATPPAADGAGSATPPRKKKKRRRKNRPVGQIPEWGWAVGGCLLAVFGCLAALGILALTGRFSLALGLGAALATAVPVGLVLLVISMFIASAVGGGIDFGDVRVAVPKAVGLLSVVTLVGFVPFIGWFLAIPIWCVGLMNLFRLDFWETRVLFIINWGVGSLFKIFILALIVGAMTSGTAGDKNRDGREQGVDTIEARESDDRPGETGEGAGQSPQVRPGAPREGARPPRDLRKQPVEADPSSRQ